MFSFDPRCRGEAGSQKWTSIPRAALVTPWELISEPWSQVKVRRKWAGNGRRALMRASAENFGEAFVSHVRQENVARGAFHEGRDR